jgi:hypothetical protein
MTNVSNVDHGIKSDSSEQFRQRNLESLCDLLDVYWGEIALSSLDAPNVGAVQTTHIGKLLLGHSEPLPPAADGSAKTDSDI